MINIMEEINFITRCYAFRIYISIQMQRRFCCDNAVIFTTFTKVPVVIFVKHHVVSQIYIDNGVTKVYGNNRKRYSSNGYKYSSEMTPNLKMNVTTNSTLAMIMIFFINSVCFLYFSHNTH